MGWFKKATRAVGKAVKDTTKFTAKAGATMGGAMMSGYNTVAAGVGGKTITVGGDNYDYFNGSKGADYAATMEKNKETIQRVGIIAGAAATGGVLGAAAFGTTAGIAGGAAAAGGMTAYSIGTAANAQHKMKEEQRKADEEFAKLRAGSVNAQAGAGASEGAVLGDVVTTNDPLAAASRRMRGRLGRRVGSGGTGDGGSVPGLAGGTGTGVG